MRLQRSSFKLCAIRRCCPVSAVLIVLLLLVHFKAQATWYDGVFLSQQGQSAQFEFRETQVVISM